MLAAGRLVLRRDVEDAVRVDIKGHLDLRHAARRRGDAVEHKGTQLLVIRGHGALALHDVDLHLGLTVGGGGKDLALPRGDGGVALDERRGHAPQRLDAQRQRGDVEQQHVLDLAAQHPRLDGGTDGDDLIGVHALVRRLAEELFHGALHERHARLPTDEDHLVDVLDLRLASASAWRTGPRLR